mgnify:CR=1 FL=1
MNINICKVLHFHNLYLDLKNQSGLEALDEPQIEFLENLNPATADYPDKLDQFLTEQDGLTNTQEIQNLMNCPCHQKTNQIYSHNIHLNYFQKKVVLIQAQRQFHFEDLLLL